MSHEIRTPLIGISGMVSFLQDTTLNEEQRDYTNTIQTSANSLLMIINDILDLSKVDAGMMKLNHEWFHTRALIEDVNELVSAMAIARRLELNYIVDEDVPTYVKGDRVRIRQVLLNVIGNAIKFTETGEVFSRCTVKSGTSKLHPNQVMLEFAVIDTGRGFTEEERNLIFKPFSQIDGSSTRAHGGSGLGLVISRQLVELHGGMMEGTAVPGKGATFTFTAKFGLPTDEDHPDAPVSPPLMATPAVIEEIPTQPFKQYTIRKHRSSASVASPTNTDQVTSPAVASSGSSNPSITSTGTRATERSSISSVNVGLSRFSEAARASGQDLSQMKLEMPSGRHSPGRTPTDRAEQSTDATDFRPPMFSILIICPQEYSREATTRHIEMTLPKDVPHQITALRSAQEAEQLIGRDDPVIFTHIIINLASVQEILHLVEEINKSNIIERTSLVILSDSIQRQDLTKLVADTNQDDLVSDSRVTYVYKPVKPSRLAVIFDPGKEGAASFDRNRSSAQRLVEDQKKSYQEVEKRMGNKGYKVLLVEDNLVNQKVLHKYLTKVGLEVELAVDGEECTNKVFTHTHGFYSLILVSETQPDVIPSSRRTLTNKCSATSTCLERMATRPAARFATGRPRTGTRACPSSHCPPTSCRTSRTSASKPASATTSRNPSTSSIYPPHCPNSFEHTRHFYYHLIVSLISRHAQATAQATMPIRCIAPAFDTFLPRLQCEMISCIFCSACTKFVAVSLPIPNHRLFLVHHATHKRACFSSRHYRAQQHIWGSNTKGRGRGTTGGQGGGYHRC